MKHIHSVVTIFALCICLTAFAQPSSPVTTPATAQPEPAHKPAAAFNEAADRALQAMTKRAEELKIKGAAVVAYFEGEAITSWSSRMAVVGTMKNAPTDKNRGSNLLAIAYSKAAEMAETLKDSGSAGRPPMTGETGWQGGLIRKVAGGYVIAAFSGGPAESDLKVSRAGLDILSAAL